MPPNSYTPIHLYVPCMFVCPRVYMPPYAPILFYASVCFWRLCMLWGVVMGSPLCWDTFSYITPVWGCLPFITTPTLSCWFPVHWYVSGISVCYVGISLLSGRVWGCFPHQLGDWGHQHLICPYAHSCTFLAQLKAFSCTITIGMV